MRDSFRDRIEPLTEPAFAARRVEIERGRRVLMTGLSFELGRGQLALITGPNGAGKTTLLRVLAGLAAPAAGTVEWGGRDVRALAPSERAGLMYRGHVDGLKKDLTVRENLEFYRALHGGTAPVDALLETLDLARAAAAPVRHLSAGQRRRTGLAVLRVGRAALWLLDEPMTNLDAAGRALVGAWVAEHLEQGGVAVVATHRPDELARSGALMIELSE